MLKFLATSKSVLQKTTYGPSKLRGSRYFADWSSDREKAFESLDVKKHDEELLRKLRESAPKDKNVQGGAKPAAATTTNTAPRSPPPQQYTREEFVPPVTNKNTSFVSMNEFLDFRKDMVNRLRELEDEIHELKAARFK